LILELHETATGDDWSLAIEYEPDKPDGISGQAHRPLDGGEYYFVAENTDHAWSVRGVCRDGQPAVGSAIDISGSGLVVTDNYELPACQKSIFAWSIKPDAGGTAGLIADLWEVGETRDENLAIEYQSDLTELISGEALVPLSGGLYYITTENVSGEWAIRWECRD
jgi:hypothetical protein